MSHHHGIEHGHLHGSSHTSALDEDININAQINKKFTYERVKEIADWILERVSSRPKIAIVCGSGLGGLGERIHDPKIFPYTTIPNFPQSTVIGHKGNLIFGKLNNVEVVCMQGRFHPYEGYAHAICTLPMKVFRLMGIETVILTAAAGGINKNYEVGDIMIIKDHIAFPLMTLQHPLAGPNDERFGPRFPPVNKLYDRNLRAIFKSVASDLKVDVKEGVYTGLGGPSYETVSEVNALSMLGGDCVGMSTAHEAVVAGYCGMKVFGLALITNKAVHEYDSDVSANHEEVVQVANMKAKVIEDLVINFVQKI